MTKTKTAIVAVFTLGLACAGDAQEASPANADPAVPAAGDTATGEDTLGEAAATAPEATTRDEPTSAPTDGAPTPWPADAPAAHKALYAGSWTPDGPEGFDEQWIDEAALRQAFSLERAGRRIWHGTQTPTNVLPLDALLRDRDGPAVAYAYIVLTRANEQDPLLVDIEYPTEPAVLHVRHRGRIRVLYDGEVVIDAPASENGEWAVATAPVTIEGPVGVVLAKTGRGSNELGPSMDFEIRASRPDGSVIEGQGWNTMRPAGVRLERDGG